MPKLENNKKTWLKITILVIAVLSMPNNAMGPAIANIVDSVFPDRTLAEVQTALGFSNFVSPVVALLTAFLINRGFLSKKSAVVGGLCLLAMSALSIIVLHGHYWQLYLASGFLGAAMGTFVTNSYAIMFDNLEARERETLAGIQTSFINGGGIMMSLVGGVLGGLIWYGGFLVLFLAIPVAILSHITIPQYKTPRGKTVKPSRINKQVYYYCAAVFVLMLFYMACGQNISSHIRNSGLADRPFLGMDLPVTTIAGVATAVQMAGGVLVGFFFGKISSRIHDYVMAVSMCLLGVGMLILSLFPTTTIMIFVGVFIAGMSISMMMPRCVYAVSIYGDSTNSALITTFVTSLAPSLGSFLSPVVFTNLTTAIGGDSTVFRYAFIGTAALCVAVIIAIVTTVRVKKGTAICE